MSHYDCTRCGTFGCTPRQCKAEDDAKADRKAKLLERLELSPKDYELLKRAVHVIELTLPETSYAKGIILSELLRDLKKRIK